MRESHEYRLERREVARMLALPLMVLAAFATMMAAGKLLGFLPAPKPALDLDRTILLHQAHASRLTNTARVLLIGDSSCLMDVVARELSGIIGEPVLNLATLSYVDLATHAKLLATYMGGNPGPTTVVLLMHPETLRLAARNEYFSDVIHSYLSGQDHRAPQLNLITQMLGVEIFRGRLLARAVPQPLPGAYGEFYGFTHDLWNHLTRHGGSAVDPRKYRAEGSAEYRLAQQLKGASEQFRNFLAPGTKLLVGLTPSPREFVLPQHEQTCAAILREWATWLGADGTLPLPSILPESQFASTTHLNPEGARTFTGFLAQTLRAQNRGVPAEAP